MANHYATEFGNKKGLLRKAVSIEKMQNTYPEVSQASIRALVGVVVITLTVLFPDITPRSTRIAFSKSSFAPV